VTFRLLAGALASGARMRPTRTDLLAGAGGILAPHASLGRAAGSAVAARGLPEAVQSENGQTTSGGGGSA